MKFCCKCFILYGTYHQSLSCEEMKCFVHVVQHMTVKLVMRTKKKTIFEYFYYFILYFTSLRI